MTNTVSSFSLPLPLPTIVVTAAAALLIGVNCFVIYFMANVVEQNA